MIDIETEHLLIKLATTLNNRDFSWGMYDCNTCVLMLSDAIFDTDYSPRIIGKYSTEEEAIAFNEENDFLGELEAEGFSETKDNEFWPGDLLIVPYKNWFSCHMYINNGDVLCCGIKEKIKIVPLRLFSTFQFSHWRKN